jgi:hypothetical protein
MADNSSPTRIATPGGEVVISTPAQPTVMINSYHDWSAPEFTGERYVSSGVTYAKALAELEPGGGRTVTCGECSNLNRPSESLLQTHTQEN